MLPCHVDVTVWLVLSVSQCSGHTVGQTLSHEISHQGYEKVLRNDPKRDPQLCTTPDLYVRDGHPHGMICMIPNTRILQQTAKFSSSALHEKWKLPHSTHICQRCCKPAMNTIKLLKMKQTWHSRFATLTARQQDPVTDLLPGGSK